MTQKWGLNFRIYQKKIITTGLLPSQPCLGILRGDCEKCFVNYQL